MWVLGVDPGSISGWGLLDPRGRPIESGQTGRPNSKKAPAQPTTGVDVRQVLEGFTEYLNLTDVVLAIEGQFLKDAAERDGKDRHKAVATLKLSRTAGRWIGVCEAMGVSVYHHKGDPGIMSQVWRQAVWGCRPSEDEVKHYAVRMTRATWGIEVPVTHHHRAEALWIAKYVGDLLRAQNRQRGLPL